MILIIFFLHICIKIFQVLKITEFGFKKLFIKNDFTDYQNLTQQFTIKPKFLFSIV